MADIREQIFIVSQVSEKNSDVRKRANEIADHIVKPIAEEFNFTVDRSDRDPTPGPVTPRILRSILDAKAVVVDLTGRNPNVYYELCFAHSFGIPVVLLIDKTKELPFDVKDERTIELGDEGSISVTQAEETKSKLRESFKVVTQADYQPNSIVNSVAGVQDIENMAPDNPVASELEAIKTRLDEIRGLSRISAQRRISIGSGYRLYDLESAMKMFEGLVSQSLVSTDDLNSLVTDVTSNKFDDWVQSLHDKYESQINTADIPF